MKLYLTSRSTRATVAVTPLTREQLAAWLAGQSTETRTWVKANAFEAEPGQHCRLSDSGGRLVRVLVGSDPENGIWSYAALAPALPPGVYAIDARMPQRLARAAALGWQLGTYQFTRYRNGRTAFPTLVCPAEINLAEIEAAALSIFLVRDLINTPAGDMGPAELAAAARGLARRHNAKLQIIKGKDLLARNYPMIHAVGRAASGEPRLIDLRWGTRRGPKVTLVGKGVCFDSGGLDLKSAANMKLMKKDMGGAAHALGLADLIMSQRLPLRLRVLVPAVENAVSGNAFRPLDILRSRKGLTVEVGNTDAEGRLILADALAEADSEKPDLIVDFATLTGAARVALGTELPAMFSNNEEVAESLLRHGAAEDDPLWRLPLHEPYRALLNSRVADLNNISDSPFGGAIVAALFLQEFVTPTTAWVHIDLMAWNLRSQPGRPEGGEAMSLRAVYALIEQMASKPKEVAKSGQKRRKP